ncbi:RNA binding protein 42 [Trichuris trichiura]|uniref:RNA-binding protein 42 n=1 Tax=Trichuris trichiura TaxID=36087 RepID=A0A077Z474_TRITR|nr:RNA binding protein 42 [Trichuris trichiura]
MDNRGHLMRQEMERFEHEINQRIPSMLPGPAGPPSLRFLPHSLQHRPFVPLPMAPRVPMQGRPMFAPPLMQPVLSFPGAPAPVVMESLPARYSGRTSATISAPPMPASKGTGEDGKGERLTTLVLSQDVNLVKSRRTDAKSSTSQSSSSKKQTRHLRTAGGVVWEDVSLSEWDPNDFRLFCGDLGNEVSDELLAKAFRKYSSFIQAKVVRDKRTNKTKGYGFVSFKDPQDFIRALREMDGKYVGNRPIKLRKSTWKDRCLDVVRKKAKEKQKLGLKL